MLDSYVKRRWYRGFRRDRKGVRAGRAVDGLQRRWSRSECKGSRNNRVVGGLRGVGGCKSALNKQTALYAGD